MILNTKILLKSNFRCSDDLSADWSTHEGNSRVSLSTLEADRYPDYRRVKVSWARVLMPRSIPTQSEENSWVSLSSLEADRYPDGQSFGATVDSNSEPNKRATLRRILAIPFSSLALARPRSPSPALALYHLLPFTFSSGPIKQRETAQGTWIPAIKTGSRPFLGSPGRSPRSGAEDRTMALLLPLAPAW